MNPPGQEAQANLSPAAPGARRSTIYDVARAAQVSYQTVSRVVNGHVGVAPHTRACVLQVIQELNYQQNFVARSLSTRSSRLLGLITAGATHYGPARVAQGIAGRAHALGYGLLLASVSDTRPQDLDAAVQRLKQFGVAGLILMLPGDVPEIARTLIGPLPSVAVNAGRNLPCTVVSTDEVAGGALATDHLIRLGHTRILHLSGPPGWSDAGRRHQGYRQALYARGLHELPCLNGDWSAESGYRAVQQALATHLDFTAIFAGNDSMALGAMAALKQAGLSVPGDVSVVGFDDAPETAYFLPGLTTVGQDFDLLGRMGVDALMRVMDVDGKARQPVMVQPRLIERNSTSRRVC